MRKRYSPGAPAPGSTEEKCGAERRSEVSSRGSVLYGGFGSRLFGAFLAVLASAGWL